MSIDELRRLYETSDQEVDEIEAKYRSGASLTRQDCNRLRHATQRIGLVARELWIRQGKPEGFDDLVQPIPLSPLPLSMRGDH